MALLTSVEADEDAGSSDAPVWTRKVLVGRKALAPGRTRPLETMWRLVVGTLVALAVLLAAGYLVGDRLAQRQVLTDARHFSELLGHGLVAPHLTPDLLQGDPRALDQLDVVIHEQLEPRSSLRRVKVWTPDGRIVYSDDRREVGRVFPLEASELHALRTGRTVTEVSNLTKDESARERELEPRLVETYTGIRAANGERLLCETYLSYEQIREQRLTVFRLLGLLAGVGVVLFTGFQLGLGLVNLRWVRRRQAELDEFASVVSDRARQRLARDLHDGTVQDLVGTALLLEGLTQSIRETRPPEAERLLTAAVGSVRSSIQSLRSVMIEVYPRSFHERGLAAALDDLAQPMRTRGLDVQVTVLMRGRLSPSASEAVFRAAQEALRNVMKHARATTAQIRVDARGELVMLSITDDGIGMATEDIASPSGHLGLDAMRDIAHERGDTLEIWSAPGVGTRIKMELRR